MAGTRKERSRHEPQSFKAMEGQLHAAFREQTVAEPQKKPIDPYAKLPFVDAAKRVTVGRAFEPISLDTIRTVFNRKYGYEGTRPKANNSRLIYVGAEVLYPKGRQARLTAPKTIARADEAGRRDPVLAGMFEPTSVGIAGVEFIPQRQDSNRSNPTINALVRVVLTNTERIEDEYRQLRSSLGIPIKSVVPMQHIDLATVGGDPKLLRSERTGRDVVRALRDVLSGTLELQPLSELSAPVTQSNLLPPDDQVRYGWHNEGYGPMLLDGTPLSTPDYSRSEWYG